jgi:hypothetical protein
MQQTLSTTYVNIVISEWFVLKICCSDGQNAQITTSDIVNGLYEN